MKNIIVFGVADFSLLMKKYIERFTRDHVVAFCCDLEYIQTSMIDGCPVVDMEKVQEIFAPEENYFLMAIGYKKMNRLRAEMTDKVRKMGYELYTFIHPSANVFCDEMGEGNIVLENVTMSLRGSIGDCNIFWNGVNISHNYLIGSYNYFAPGVVTGGNIVMGNNCFLGLNCTLKNSVDIADFSFVGAGVYASFSTKKHSVIAAARDVVLENKTSDDMEI